MAEQKHTEQALHVFDTLCAMMEKNKWHYTPNSEKLFIDCKAQGDDLPIDINIRVDSLRRTVSLLSKLPCVAQEDKRIDMAIAVNAVNARIVDGSFDYDIKTGDLYFRMTNSFFESEIGGEVFEYMLICSFGTIDEYNDKFLMLAKGIITVEQFVSSIMQ